jgi:hypothetical protein
MNYYNKQLHDCIYNSNNKTKAIVYKKQILLEKNLHIIKKTFDDYFKEAQDKYYLNSYSWNRRDGKTNRSSPTIIVLSTHLYQMMISERNSYFYLEYCTGLYEGDTPKKFKYRGIQVEINYYNQDDEINLY